MKWLEILATWTSTLQRDSNDVDVLPTDDFSKLGTYNADNRVFSIAPENMPSFVTLLTEQARAVPALSHLLTLLTQQHAQLAAPFCMLATNDVTNNAWTEICAALFRNHWLLHWRATLRTIDGNNGLEYCGLHDSEAFLFGSEAYIENVRNTIYNVEDAQAIATVHEELLLIVFQMLWTFASLSRLGLHIQPPASDPYGLFTNARVQRGRVEHFGKMTESENAFYVCGNNLETLTGVYLVPVRRAFVTLRYDPVGNAPRFGHLSYEQNGQQISVHALCQLPGVDRRSSVSLKEIERGTYLAHMAGLLRRFIFRKLVKGQERVIQPTEPSFQQLYKDLLTIELQSAAYETFFDTSLALTYWRKFNAQQCAQIIARLGGPTSTLTVLYMPQPAAAFPSPQRVYRQNWCGFDNVDNNCFLNSTLFMLMCPAGAQNSFMAAVRIYAACEEPSKEDYEFARSIKGRIDNPVDVERARQLLAYKFCATLLAAFTLSNLSTWQPAEVRAVNAEIHKHCELLFPLLDLWSLAHRGYRFARRIGEFQDVGECLQLLGDLLHYENWCVSTVAVTEEFPTLLFAEAEQRKLTVAQLEELSLEQRNNPLCIRVQSSLQAPVICLSVDWSVLPTLADVVDFQAVCDASANDASYNAEPLTEAQKEQERASGVTILRATRLCFKRHLRSRGTSMVVVYMPRHNDFGAVHHNRVVFPASELLSIGGEQMRIVSLTAWSHSHYTSLVYCSDTRRWWHINDMGAPGYRCEDFGGTLAEAVAQIDAFGKIVTTVTCCAVARDNETLSRAALERHICREVQKLSMPSDSMLHKAIVLHKDNERFRSANAALLLMESALTILPQRFLFGHDNPNTDFYFRPAWYNAADAPFPPQPVELAIVLAMGVSPTALSHVSSRQIDEEQHVVAATALFPTAALPAMQERAQHTCRALEQLASPECSLGVEAVDATLQVFQMQHLRKTPREYIAAGGFKGLWQLQQQQREDGASASTGCCALPAQFYSLMRQSFTRVAAYSARGERNHRFVSHLLMAEQILIPIFDNAKCHWSLVCVQPQFREIAYFDSLARDGMEHLTAVAQYMVHLQKADNDNTACVAQWTLRNVWTTAIQTVQNTSGLLVLFFCQELFEGRGKMVEQIRDDSLFEPHVLQTFRQTFAELVENAGNLQPYEKAT
jgi:hypothetical protein